MDKNNRPMRVLWFANTPGLSAGYLKISLAAGGWISSLQQVVEGLPGCELGFVFYAEQAMAPFEHGRTWYFPVQPLGSSKGKRLLSRIAGRAEYDENLPKFLEAVRQFKPDIIHVHGTEFSFGLIAREVKHIPVVVSIQGNLTVYNEKYTAGLSLPGWWHGLRTGYPFYGADYRIWRKRMAIEQEILRHTAFIFGRTDWDRRIALALAPKAAYYHVDEVIRPSFYRLARKGGAETGAEGVGSEIEGVESAVEGLESWTEGVTGKGTPAGGQRGSGQRGAPVFFTTSSPSIYKGFETVIDTAAILARNGVAFTWVVAGLKAEHPLVKLILRERRVKDPAALNIRLPGTLTEEEVARHLQTADAYVQVSHIENSPNSVCEAMLAGIPVIASFAGGTGSLLQDGVHGVLVQDGDPYALAGAMQEVVRDRERYRVMALEAQKVARRRHDPAGVAALMLERYAEIIEKHAVKK